MIFHLYVRFEIPVESAQVSYPCFQFDSTLIVNDEMFKAIPLMNLYRASEVVRQYIYMVCIL